ncbi:MAG: adenylate/guanylate cyclase domain-containing protein [Burkholderiales bacterium]|nr:adenylate/guanylate cyclase domain-containing protein [Burkholderiales bacterium]
MAELIRNGTDRELNRVNVLEFAQRHGVNEEGVIAAFVHAARLGLFDMVWSLLCPGCGGVLSSNNTLKHVHQRDYHCALCATAYEPTLDQMVEVSFTVNPRVRRIAAHEPHKLPLWEYYRQAYWSSGIDVSDEEYDRLVPQFTLAALELPSGEQHTLTVELPQKFIIVFEPVTHTAHFIDVQGEPTTETQEMKVAFDHEHTPVPTTSMRPGPLRLTLQNRIETRALPSLFIADDPLHDMLVEKKRFLTATRLFTNQTFRDIYRTDTLDIDQRLKITSLTFLFTDLKGSTELYERVGDLVAYDMVKAHFHVLNDVIAAQTGAVVKTIGDAVMATFPTPDRGLAAALRMREAMHALNQSRDGEDLLLKIGLHEGPCLAVTLNDRLDYFGQSVNIAARVQGLAMSRSIFATKPVVEHPEAKHLLDAAGLTPVQQSAMLKGISEEFCVFEIP